VLSEQKQEGRNEKNRNSVPIFQKLKLLKKIEVALEELGELPESEKLGRSEKALLKALPAFLSNIKGSAQEIEAFIRQQK
jgi:ParB family chromosome partitioning protein